MSASEPELVRARRLVRSHTLAAETADDVVALARDGNAFAAELYRVLCFAPGNLLFSPFSISRALAMVHLGARGETAAEMARVLGFALPRERLDAGQEALLRIVGESAGPEGRRAHELAIANGVWVATGEAPREEFVLGVRRCHGGSVEVADFRGDPEGSRRAINGWVYERTRGRITDLIPPRGIDPRERLVLANAVYFKGRWAQPFDPGRTRKLPFYTGGQSYAVPMMHQVDSFGYAEDAGVQVVEIPYRGHALSAVIVLPQEIDGLPALERELDWPMLQRWVEQVRPRSVALTLPKFKLSSQFALAERLAGMGMRKAFDPAAADLSGILGKPNDLFVDIVSPGTGRTALECRARAALAVLARRPERASCTPRTNSPRLASPLVRSPARGERSGPRLCTAGTCRLRGYLPPGSRRSRISFRA